MPNPKAIHVPDGHDDNQRIVDISETLKEVADTSRVLDRAEEVMAKKSAFIKQAVEIGGFTEKQAQWLWDNKATHGPLR